MRNLRCAQLANASRVLGNLGDDILSKITLKSGVGTIVETGSDDGHFMALRGPVTLRHMRFRLTDLDGNVVRLRGSSLSFVLCAGDRAEGCAGPAAAARRGRTAGTSGPRSGGRG